MTLREEILHHMSMYPEGATVEDMEFDVRACSEGSPTYKEIKEEFNKMIEEGIIYTNPLEWGRYDKPYRIK